jgi:hypothetical protein
MMCMTKAHSALEPTGWLGLGTQGERHLGVRGVTQELRDELACRHHFAEIHARSDTQAVNHVQHVLRRHISGSSAGVRAATETSDRTVHYSDALLHMMLS